MSAETATPEASVNDIPDAELIRRVIASMRRTKTLDAGQLRWAAVAWRFSLGSTYAAQLCRRFGFDPDERVRAKG